METHPPAYNGVPAHGLLCPFLLYLNAISVSPEALSVFLIKLTFTKKEINRKIHGHFIINKNMVYVKQISYKTVINK